MYVCTLFTSYKRTQSNRHFVDVLSSNLDPLALAADLAAEEDDEDGQGEPTSHGT